MALDYKDIYAARRGMGEDRVISLLEYEGARALLEGKKEGLSIAEKAAHLANELDEAITTYKKEVSQQWKLEQGRVVYGILRKALNDQEVNAYMAEHMPKEHERFNRNLNNDITTGRDKQYEAQNKKLAQRYSAILHTSLRGLKHSREEENRYEKTREVYGVIRMAFGDDQIKAYLKDNMPREYEKFEKNLTEIKSKGLQKQFEEKAAQLSRQYLKELNKQINEFKESKYMNLEEKINRSRSIYYALRTALTDPLVNQHMKENMPKEHERFNKNMNSFSNQKLHRQFEQEIEKKSIDMHHKEQGFGLDL